ncbi:NirD/YgiW/YdeI family stress tolerance protein [Massilia sp.]|uniref:YgiW/YdeI family stress tolerance OB fold protein n=1 Tax=Massilia sp. TaxID=1882437 RepID=UPI002896BDC3|nr:NirD/YgiW/YdeI family stress tolerance protein [Massilia sp.]
MKRIIKLSAIATLLAGSAFAIAQNGTAPAAAPTAAPAATATATAPAAKSGYTGPSGAPLMSVKDLLAKGKDDQYVRLKGKLTSHKGDEDYEFTDASGKITVEIDSDRFPQGVTVDHNTTVELTGEFDKEMFGESTLDVEQIKVVGS